MKTKSAKKKMSVQMMLTPNQLAKIVGGSDPVASGTVPPGDTGTIREIIEK